MSIAKFMVIKCDAEGCTNQTPMLDYDPVDGLEGAEEETIRTEHGYSFLDVPFSGSPSLYICQECWSKLAGE